MPRHTAVCRRVSHHFIYSAGAPKMPLHAIGSKNSAYSGASGAHRLAWRPDSDALIAKCGEPLQRGFPVLVFVGVDLAVLELLSLLCPLLDRHRGFGRMRRLGVQGEARAVGCGHDAEGVLEPHEQRHEVARSLDAVILEGVDGHAERRGDGLEQLGLHGSDATLVVAHGPLGQADRYGELLALTPSDFMLESSRLRINKSYQSLHGVDTVTAPKTPKSVRTIVMPAFLRDEMADFIEMRDDVATNERLFAVTKHFLAHEIERGCKASGVKRIRIHDIRHSHVSLLIEMGFAALTIAERMGHEAVDITYRYAYLFPTKQDEMAIALDGARG